MGNGDSMGIDIDSDEDAVASRLDEMQIETQGFAHALSGSSQSQNSTKSISGSFIEPIVENDRTYVDDTYYLPNDDAEATSDSMCHQVYIAALSGRLTFHRMKPDVSRMLDVGANPGDWAIAVAERYPQAEVVATDLGPCELADLPPNLVFQVDDAREEWTYAEPFDYIHIRGMAGAFSDWRFIYDQACKHLGEDGILEVVDRGPVHHNTSVPDSYLDIYNAACQQAAELSGVSLGAEHLRREVIEEVGLRIFRSATVEVPVGQWHPDRRQKSAGRMALVGSLERLEAQSLRLLTKYLDWSAEDVKDLCEKVMEEILLQDTKPSMTCTFVIARKFPES